MTAYDHYLRSLSRTDDFTREAVDEMLDGCLQAISLDPSFAPAYALAARAYIQKLIQGWNVDEAKERREVLELVEAGLRADRAHRLSPRDSRNYAIFQAFPKLTLRTLFSCFPFNGSADLVSATAAASVVDAGGRRAWPRRGHDLCRLRFLRCWLGRGQP